MLYCLEGSSLCKQTDFAQLGSQNPKVFQRKEREHQKRYQACEMLDTAIGNGQTGTQEPIGLGEGILR